MWGLSIRFPLLWITNLCKHLCVAFCVDIGFQQMYPRAAPESCGEALFSFSQDCQAVFWPFFSPGQQ